MVGYGQATDIDTNVTLFSQRLPYGTLWFLYKLFNSLDSLRSCLDPLRSCLDPRRLNIDPVRLFFDLVLDIVFILSAFLLLSA